MLLTDLLLKVENVEPGAELKSHGYGHWSIVNPRKRNPTQTDQPLMLARVVTFPGTHPKTGLPVNKVDHVKIVGNTGPRKQLRVWMLLWGVTLR